MLWIILSTLTIVSMWCCAGLAALNAARTARTPQGAVGWLVFLLSLPIIALPAYMFFGHHRFSGYRKTRQASHAAVRHIQETTQRDACDPRNTQINPQPFEAVAGLAACGGNDAQLLINGDKTFEAIFHAIDAATDYVLVQFYIIRSDPLGQQLLDHLKQARTRGVSVWFMADRVGSHGLSRTYLRELAEAGVNLVDRATMRGPRHRFTINYRNHRKTVVVDGKVAFSGGLNVGVEYKGLDPQYPNWRDTHLQLRGPMVQQLQLSFAEDWHWLTDEPIVDLLHWTTETMPANMTGLIVPTGPGDLTETGSMLFVSAIIAAKTRLWIASPYFVPDSAVISALKNAALRGVDVRILTTGVVDHYLPWLASFGYFDDLRQAGVRIFRYTKGFMHQKVFVVDDELSAVGTTNMDNRSFMLNFETMCLLFDEGFTATVADMLEEDFRHTDEVRLSMQDRAYRIQLLSPVARLFAPVL